MRFAIFLVAAFAIYQSALALPSKNTRVFEDVIVAAAECIRGLLISGLPDYNIPSFNPLELDELTVNGDDLDVDNISGYLSVRNLVLSGITDFVLSNEQGTIGLIPPRYVIQLRLTFPRLNFVSDHEGNFNYNDENVYGSGSLSFEAVNFVADVEATVTILGGIQLSDFSLWVSLEGLNSFEITGLYDDEEYSQYVTDLILSDPSGTVAEYAPLVNEIARELVLEIANGNLDDEDGLLSDLIDTCVDL